MTILNTAVPLAVQHETAARALTALIGAAGPDLAAQSWQIGRPGFDAPVQITGHDYSACSLRAIMRRLARWAPHLDQPRWNLHPYRHRSRDGGQLQITGTVHGVSVVIWDALDALMWIEAAGLDLPARTPGSAGADADGGCACPDRCPVHTWPVTEPVLPEMYADRVQRYEDWADDVRDGAA